MNQPRSGKRTATAIGSVRCTPSWEPGSQCRNSGQGTHFPLFLEPRRLAEQVLSGNPGGRIGWMSTRKVDDLMQGTGHDGHLQALGVGLVPEYRRAGVVSEPVARRRMALHLWLDATYLKVQQGGRVVSVVAIIACGVNQERQRENFGIGPRGIGSPSVLGGVSPEPQAPGSFQRRPTGHFRRLRGPQGRHCAGLPGGPVSNAVGRTSPRNLLASVPKVSQSLVSTLVRQMFVRSNADSARKVWRQVADQLWPRFPKVADLMDQAEADILVHPTLSCAAPRQAPLYEQFGAAQQKGEATGLRGGHLLGQAEYPPVDRGRPHGTERGLVVATPLSAPAHDAGNYCGYQRLNVSFRAFKPLPKPEFGLLNLHYLTGRYRPHSSPSVLWLPWEISLIRFQVKKLFLIVYKSISLPYWMTYTFKPLIFNGHIQSPAAE